jgi:hypothetical protein
MLKYFRHLSEKKLKTAQAVESATAKYIRLRNRAADDVISEPEQIELDALTAELGRDVVAELDLQARLRELEKVAAQAETLRDKTQAARTAAHQFDIARESRAKADEAEARRLHSTAQQLSEDAATAASAATKIVTLKRDHADALGITRPTDPACIVPPDHNYTIPAGIKVIEIDRFETTQASVCARFPIEDYSFSPAPGQSEAEFNALLSQMKRVNGDQTAARNARDDRETTRRNAAMKKPDDRGPAPIYSTPNFARSF